MGIITRRAMDICRMKIKIHIANVNALEEKTGCRICSLLTFALTIHHFSHTIERQRNDDRFKPKVLSVDDPASRNRIPIPPLPGKGT